MRRFSVICFSVKRHSYPLPLTTLTHRSGLEKDILTTSLTPRRALQLERRSAPQNKLSGGPKAYRSRMRYLLFMLLALPATGLQMAAAHATIVLGHFEVLPGRPAEGAPLQLRLRLEDPTQVPIQDAVVFADLRPAGQPNAEPVRAEFSETQTPGTYEAMTTLAQPGPYRIVLRDRTYRQEEATATLTQPLRVGGANTAQDFNFPPTATGSAGWRTWLLWLLGLPLVAALLVTVLVLTRGDGKAAKASEKPTSGNSPSATRK